MIYTALVGFCCLKCVLKSIIIHVSFRSKWVVSSKKTDVKKSKTIN